MKGKLYKVCNIAGAIGYADDFDKDSDNTPTHTIKHGEIVVALTEPVELPAPSGMTANDHPTCEIHVYHQASGQKLWVSTANLEEV